ncbi:MAG: NADH-quinone oxidoreductase subunit C [Bryobacter sp.]|nr:NADH-quinone oxidoreductase subunit C [Bryobacter sp.]
MVTEEALQSAAVQAAAARFGEAIVAGEVFRGETTLYIEPSQIVTVCEFLKQGHGFDRLSSVTCVDWHPMEPRFEVVYHLHATARHERLRLKVKLAGEAAEIDSVFSVWRSADWYEREVFDLFGVQFRNHPNLKRILLPEGWQGHPLRKDFPVHGYKYSYQNE